jgi:hypothetical protein
VAKKAQEAPVPRNGSAQSKMLPRIRKLSKGAHGAQGACQETPRYIDVLMEHPLRISMVNSTQSRD